MGKVRIMVVDDESVARMDIREMLEEAGYEVVAEASDGEVAVEKAFRYKPDLILMDVKLPKMSGLKASRIIYEREQTPIIALTAYSGSEFVEEAKSVGVIGYLVKPVTEAELIPGIEMTLGQSARLKNLSRQIVKLEETLAFRKLLDRAKGIVMAQLSLSENDAYEYLRKHSMNVQVPMQVLVRQVIAHGCLPLS